MEISNDNNKCQEKENELESLCDGDNVITVAVIDEKSRPAGSRINSILGISATLLSSVFSAFSIVLVKKAQLFTGPEQTIVRLGVQLVTMLSIAFHQHVNVLGPAKERKLLLFRGFLGMIGQTGFHSAIKFINPSDAVTIFQTNVIFVAILARLILNEKLSFVDIFSMILAIAGLY